jgi:hypothetical protein
MMVAFTINGFILDRVGQQHGVAAGGQTFLEIAGAGKVSERHLHPQYRLGKGIISVAAHPFEHRPGRFEPVVQHRGRVTDENSGFNEIGQCQELAPLIAFP